LEGLRALIAAASDLRVVATATDGERLLDAIGSQAWLEVDGGI